MSALQKSEYSSEALYEIRAGFHGCGDGGHFAGHRHVALAADGHDEMNLQQLHGLFTAKRDSAYSIAEDYLALLTIPLAQFRRSSLRA